MIPLYSQEEFKLSKSKDTLPLKCEYCKKTFYKTKHHIQGALNPNCKTKGDTCSFKCSKKYRDKKQGNESVELICKQCKSNFLRWPSQLERSNNYFCSESCAAIYNNKHVSRLSKVSKLEDYLQSLLPKKYPDLKFLFNDRLTIGLELDIYIPSLKLAFELNGIFHYEPIFGEEQLKKTQDNDKIKKTTCKKQDIILYSIDTTSQKVFKEKESKIFVDFIKEKIDNKLTEGQK